MNAFSLLVALVVASPVEPDTGYSYDQILQMGHESFVEYYYEHVGMSTAGMVGAEHAYAKALGWRNDISAKKAKDSAIPALRKQLGVFSAEITFIGSCYTGGGTMWHPVYAHNAVQTEELLDLLLSDAKINQRIITAAEVNTKFNSLYKAATGPMESDSYSQEWNQPKTRRAALDRARGAWTSIQSLVKKRSIRDRLSVMHRIDAWLEIPDFSGE